MRSSFTGLGVCDFLLFVVSSGLEFELQALRGGSCQVQGCEAASFAWRPGQTVSAGRLRYGRVFRVCGGAGQGVGRLPGPGPAQLAKLPSYAELVAFLAHAFGWPSLGDAWPQVGRFAVRAVASRARRC